MKTRNEFPEYLKSLGLNGVGVEIGVAYGEFSYHLLENSNLEKLFSIDPWSKDCDGFNHTKNPQENAQNAFVITVNKLKEFKQRSSIIRERAEDIHYIFDENELDFIYIDSSHKYEDTKKQIELYWPKLKTGGVFAGHDYCNGPEIQKAVYELFPNNTIMTTENDDIADFLVNSWYIIK